MKIFLNTVILFYNRYEVINKTSKMYLQIEFLNIQDTLKLNKSRTFKTNIFIENEIGFQSKCIS